MLFSCPSVSRSLRLGKLWLLVGFFLHAVIGTQGFCLLPVVGLLPPVPSTISTSLPTTLASASTTTTALQASSNTSLDMAPSSSSSSVHTSTHASNQSSSCWYANPATLLPRVLQHYKTEYQLRMAADPSFLQKSILEVMVAASAQLAAEWNRRGWDRLLPEIEWVLPAVLTAVFGKYYSMWRVAPTTRVSKNPTDASSNTRNNDTLFWNMPVPTNAFQPYLMDGITRPTLLQRLASILAPMKSLFQAGFGSSFVGYGVGALLLRARALWPGATATTSATTTRVTQPVNILHASIFTGFFLMIVSNLRYQILQGWIEPTVDRVLFGLSSRRDDGDKIMKQGEQKQQSSRLLLRPLVFGIIRWGNGWFGSVLAIMGMRWLGLQKPRGG